MSDKLITHLKELIRTTKSDTHTQDTFLERAEQGNVTRDEDPYTHFCIYFAAFDSKQRQVFIGNHKKSDLWLFNGGHIDKGESPQEALKREAKEEWGNDVKLDRTYSPSLLTITKIENPTKQICKHHFDIWYFIPFDKTSFTPDKKLLEKEFYKAGWKQMKEARHLIIDVNTLTALSEIEKRFDNAL